MKYNDENDIQPLHMLPRFDSHVFLKISHSISEPQLTRLLLPRFRSDHHHPFYNENQSAEATISQTKLIINQKQDINYRANKFDIKVLERVFDQTGKKCSPILNTNIKDLDLEYAYEIIGDTLESYIRYRKLDRCKALSNFIDYRNKVYKREKIAQYALPETKAHRKDLPTKQKINTPPIIIQVKEKQSTSASPSTISHIVPSPAISLSSPSVVSTISLNPSPQISKESFIPIPSPDLLKTPVPKSIQPTSPLKQKNLNVPKKINSNIKQTSSVKGQS
ncbi:hypothetical protein I4U23_029590 [Adineta vaga]|nr:hypothetical protein I4U23_029590 [Adineta vaga]